MNKGPWCEALEDPDHDVKFTKVLAPKLDFASDNARIKKKKHFKRRKNFFFIIRSLRFPKEMFNLYLFLAKES